MPINHSSASRIADLRLQALELNNKTFTATSSARHIGSGCTFSLMQHAHYPESGDANQFKVLQVTHSAANNLPAQVAQLLQSAGFEAKYASGTHNTGASSSQKHSGQNPGETDPASDPNSLTNLPRGTYRNRFNAVRAVVPVVPAAINAPMTATAPGPQTAIVVGLAGEQLTTERNHSVKVQFAWQRGANPLPGGLTELNSPDPASAGIGNAPGNETSGAWVRVAEALAGPNWGSQFTPRIGTEVLIDFIDGDMDQPVVVAQLYNGQDMPPFAAGVDAGVNHGGTISGWHSHNLAAGKDDQDNDAAQTGGGGYNQWVLDDTTGQLRMRLASSTAVSQLNTGYLIGQSPTSAQRGAYRGSGFELRTDAWGVLRAPQGLLLSTTTRAAVGTTGITSTQMDTLEARAQLRGAQSLSDALQEAASQAQALGTTQVKDTQAAQKLLLERLEPTKKGSFASQGLATLNGQSTQKTLTSGEQAGRGLVASAEAAVERVRPAIQRLMRSSPSR